MLPMLFVGCVVEPCLQGGDKFEPVFVLKLKFEFKRMLQSIFLCPQKIKLKLNMFG